MAATRACSRASVSECAFCTHAPAIITISACVLRTRDYYFSGEPASFPLTRPYYTSRNDKDRSFLSFWKFCSNKFANVSSEIYSTPCLCTMRLCRNRERARHVSAKNKNRKGKKKISKKAFTSRPMNRRNFSSRGLLVSILLNSRPWKRWCASLKLGIWIKIIKGIVYFD